MRDSQYHTGFQDIGYNVQSAQTKPGHVAFDPLVYVGGRRPHG